MQFNAVQLAKVAFVICLYLVLYIYIMVEVLAACGIYTSALILMYNLIMNA